MAENSKIEWTDHSFNPVWGCTQIAPGCDNCYAMELDKRWHKGANWGPKNMPRRTKPQNWNKVRKWNKTAEITGKEIKVFCASMADICDKNWQPEWREDLWQLIRETPNLTWQLLTKRASLIERFIPLDIRMLPNVWMGATVENGKEGLERAKVLAEIDCNLRWLSIEPLIGRVRFSAHLLERFSWVVIGGESGKGYRPMELDWVLDIFRSARALSIPIFFKQWPALKSGGNGCLLDGIEIKEFPGTRGI